MTINEAAALAHKQGKFIKREGSLFPCKLMPTNTGPLATFVINTDGRERNISRYFNPSLEDLVAEDWILVD